MSESTVREAEIFFRHPMTLASRGSAERRQAMVEYLRQMTCVVTESSSDEERIAALDAIVTEIKGKEALIATDQRLSKVLEKLVSANAACVDIVVPVMRALCDGLLDLIYDQYGSHVVETVLKCLSTLEKTDDTSQLVSRFVGSVCSDLVGIIRDARATYSVRSAVMYFGGFEVEEGSDLLSSVKKSPKATQFADALSEILSALEILETSDLIELSTQSAHSAYTLQVILVAGSHFDSVLTEKLLRKLMFTPTGPINVGYISLALDDKIGSKFMETVVDISQQRKYNDILDSLFCWCKSEEVFDLKFSFGFLQHTITGIDSADRFRGLVDQLFTVEGMRMIVSKGGNHGIGLIQRGIEKAVTLVEFQKVLFSNLLTAIGVLDSSFYGLVWSVLLGLNVNSFITRNAPSATEEDFTTRMTPAGCLLASTLMGFKQSVIQPMISNAAPLVEALHDVDIVNSKWLTDVSVGRCLQTIISVQSAIPTGIRKKIIKGILLNENRANQLRDIVMDRKVGAWLVTTAWDSCAGDVQTKQALGDGLLAVEGLRESNWKVWRYCGLATFSRHNSDWTANETRKAKAQNYFKDIIGDVEPTKKHRTN